jgi:hypothetical protein
MERNAEPNNETAEAIAVEKVLPHDSLFNEAQRSSNTNLAAPSN